MNARNAMNEYIRILLNIYILHYISIFEKNEAKKTVIQRNNKTKIQNKLSAHIHSVYCRWCCRCIIFKQFNCMHGENQILFALRFWYPFHICLFLCLSERFSVLFLAIKSHNIGHWNSQVLKPINSVSSDRHRQYSIARCVSLMRTNYPFKLAISLFAFLIYYCHTIRTFLSFFLIAQCVWPHFHFFSCIGIQLNSANENKDNFQSTSTKYQLDNITELLSSM